MTLRIQELEAQLAEKDAETATAVAATIERAAQECEEPHYHEASCPVHNGGDNCDCGVGELTDSIRQLATTAQSALELERDKARLDEAKQWNDYHYTGFGGPDCDIYWNQHRIAELESRIAGEKEGRR